MSQDIEKLREALSSMPNNLPLLSVLASQLLQNGLFSEAEIEYRTALKLAPHDIELTLGLAKTYLEQKKIAAGLILFEELLKQHPDNAVALLIHAKFSTTRPTIRPSLGSLF